MSEKKSIGVLLINVGTPDAPETSAVRRYLREFLSDPRVLDINPIVRWLLLRLIILPFRSPKSARAYRQIWTAEGSPLLSIGNDLSIAVQELLGDDYRVTLAMRYGNPNIESGIDKLLESGVDSIKVLPLYPQYSSAATGTCAEKVFEILGKRWNVPPVEILPPFYDHPGFIYAVSEVAKEHLKNFNADMVLMSYHGLPERHVQKSWAPGFTACDIKAPCPAIQSGNANCYRAQCFATSRLLAKSIGLGESDYSVSFQSRLGRDPWIQPFTDLVLPELYEKGVRRLAIMCPAFVADCLETIEEIGIRAKEDWLALGGEELILIPCVNTTPQWSESVASMLDAGFAKSHPVPDADGTVQLAATLPRV